MPRPVVRRLAATRRTRVLLAVAVALVLVTAGVAWALVGTARDDAGVSEQARTVRVGEEADGSRVSLDASVFTPSADAPGADADGRRAAVLLAHGFGGDKTDLVEQARDTAAEGYVVLTWTARGFGESGGLIHLDDPDYEVADASVLLDLLAARDDVRLDAEGDPRVGVAGASYGGALALLLAAADDRVDAIVPAITWNDLGGAFFPQDAESLGGGETPAAGVFKQGWASRFVSTTVAQGGDEVREAAGSVLSGGEVCGRLAPDLCRLFADAAEDGRPRPGGLERLRRSSPDPVLSRIQAPTLLVQGAQDSLFGLDQSDANARGIAAAGTEVAVRWIDGGHDAGGPELAGELTTPALAWFDHQLRDGPAPEPGFELALPAAPLGDDGPTRLRAAAYGETETVTLGLRGEPQPVLSPAGGQPAALTSLPGAGGLLGEAVTASGAAFGLAALPGQTAVFTSEPATRTVTVAGSPRVRLSVTSSVPDATLFASGWIVSAEGTARLPRQLVSPFRLTGLTPGTPAEVEVRLPASAYQLQAGQRLRVVVTSTDSAFAGPDDQRLYAVALAGDEVELPTVETTRVGSTTLAPWPLVVAVAALLLLAAAWAGLARWRRRSAAVAHDAALAEVPLTVRGLVKEYADGFRAVDAVSWRAERGQVVGLLGPNGAGKTTTMRMLVGLIHADAGDVHVLGERIGPGSPVLARVGALIEGPGFLPHLSGRQNLDAWWAATGRPAAESRVEEVMDVADLGVAIDRPVRSYSQGMRQRLGIAQAMLGLPEVLLLDEPTNGLDPPQIRRLRGVLARYAAAGRTVVVSSHLLAEVEQTCSHVVVMHRGRVVLEGAVPELLAVPVAVLVEVDGDTELAARVVSDVAGVRQVTAQDGRLRVEGGERRDVVAALVRADIGVTSVDGRRHLEEVFMGLVGDDSAAQRAAGAEAR
ncbi:alpha/beta fold hydrolase [Nocardioides aequoreus]|uniref:alpha/beta fold hydrolase n=1 Tax=Nocardioides aequoreus TaxID=397278 RepID=UPI0004C381B0|nr:alpha/beta fold hydrolase [Nocardioides aequoreus]